MHWVWEPPDSAGLYNWLSCIVYRLIYIYTYTYAPVFSRPVSPSCVCDDVPLVDLDPLPEPPPPLAAPAVPLGALPVAAGALLLLAVAAGVSDAAGGLGATGSIMACGVVSTSCGSLGGRGARVNIRLMRRIL